MINTFRVCLRRRLALRPAFIAAFLLVFLTANNVFYFFGQPLPDGKDSCAHVRGFLNLWQLIAGGKESALYDAGRSFFYNIIFCAFDYPPLFYFTAAALKLLLGGIIFYAPLLVSTFFMLALLLGTYAAGRMIHERAGVIAVVICAFFPLVYVASRHFNPETALAAMVVLSVWLLLKTEFFQKRTYSVWLGVCAGLGMLTKQSFIVYFIGPFLVTFLFALRARNGAQRINPAKNILFFCLCFLGISALFYHRRDIYVSAMNRMQFYGAVEKNNLWEPAHLFYYFNAFIRAAGWLYASAAGLSLFFLRRLRRDYRCVLLSWMFVPPVILGLAVLKYGEYLLPVLPAAALSTAFMIAAIWEKKRAAALSLMILLTAGGMLGYFKITLGQEHFFYSRYYPDNFFALARRVDSQAGRPHGNAAENPQSLSALIRLLGSGKNIIGMFSDDRCWFPSYFQRGMFAFANEPAQVVDFIAAPEKFLNNLPRYDHLIFVCASETEDIDEGQMRKTIERLNKTRFNRINLVIDAAPPTASGDVNVPEALLADFAAELRERFMLFRRLEFGAFDAAVREHVFIYRRKGL